MDCVRAEAVASGGESRYAYVNQTDPEQCTASMDFPSTFDHGLMVLRELSGKAQDVTGLASIFGAMVGVGQSR